MRRPMDSPSPCSTPPWLLCCILGVLAGDTRRGCVQSEPGFQNDREMREIYLYRIEEVLQGGFRARGEQSIRIFRRGLYTGQAVGTTRRPPS